MKFTEPKRSTKKCYESTTFAPKSTKIRNLAILVSHFALKVHYSHHFPSFSPKFGRIAADFYHGIIFLFWLCMEVSQGPDFSGDPFRSERTLITLLKNPACRQQNRGASGARRNSNFSCTSDVLTSDAEGPADVVGAHMCTG